MLSAKEAAPDFRDVISAPNAFSNLIEERSRLRAEIEEAKTRLTQIDEEITEQLADAGAPKVQYGKQVVALVESSRHNLSKEKLVELGVPVGIVQQATTTTKFTYILVR